ncbi:ABC transporter ATP-binding protein [Brevibacillus dissolubilis]|uniref:ABC transporter ATP-binding protein n=1 Tax=Brevibacillus dissolubilis TaxID=1844116 RepID=UPI0011165FBF|nr:ABC transporter ATP-binding protein [Brevibacillus dissolubilis]
MNTKTETLSWKSFTELLKTANPPKALIALAMLLSLIQTAAGLVVPYLTKEMVDMLSQAALQSSLIILLALAFVAQAVSSGLSIYLLAYVGQKTVASLRKRFWEKLLKLPIPYFDQNRTGETISRLTGDTGAIKDFISNHVVSFLSDIISIIGSIIILTYIDWQMTIVLLFAIPVLTLIVRPIGRRIHAISRQLQNETAELSGFLTEVLGEIRLVKSFNAEPLEEANGAKGIDKLLTSSLREAKIYAYLSPIVQLTMMTVLTLIVGYGGVRVSSGELSAGELVAFLLYLFKIVMPFGSLAQFYTAVQKALGATERIRVLFAHESESSRDTKEVTDAHQPIHLRSVGFSYATSDRILHDLTLTIEPGKVTAFVGPSGGGKTTIFSLLERFYDPTEGEILLGDTAIQDFSLSSWRSQLGYVSQESPLMAGTVRQNICYGVDRDVSEAEIIAAAKQAYADEFISGLPDGYDTEIGERGIKLSGGQRQRIAIARAILRNPQILLLDEATSNLDSESEQLVQKALTHLMEGRTTVVIAHRLSTVVKAEKIVVIEKGRVSGEGTHEELLVGNGLYRRLAEGQFGV